MKKVWGPAEAEIVKSFLNNYGIKCVFLGQANPTSYPIATDGLGEIKIMVAEEDYDLALELLKNIPD
ncbi:MAG: DUF2007 domain-containing protein [Candidatus Aminicenantes bacterium]|nr:DUF2007 domain-containing protein [Candidatus Aminicenantes bacterium]